MSTQALETARNHDPGQLWPNGMLSFFRLLIVTGVCLGLVVVLGRNIYNGLVTGKIAHSDTSKFCRRDSNPLGFWTVVSFQAAFIIVILAVWWDLV